MKILRYLLLLIVTVTFLFTDLQAQNNHVRAGVFEVDVTPPIGSPVAYAKNKINS
jgi:hypothetical protein